MLRDLLSVVFLIFVLFALFPGLFLMDGVLFFHDILHHHYPWRAYNGLQYRALSIPLWNPLGGCGFPMLADGQSGPLYLPNVLLFSLLHPLVACNLLVVSHFFLAGLFAYILCRRLRISRPGSLLSSIVYMVSGFAISHLTFLHMLSAYPWLPLVLILVDEGRRRAVFVALAGAVIGVQFTAGHPQIAAYSLLAALFYTLWRFGPRARRLIPAILIVLLFSLAIPAAQLLPTAELTALSVREGAAQEFLGWGSFPPFQVINFLFPRFFGYDSPASVPVSYHMEGWGYWGVGVNYWEFCFYLGVVPLLLAFAAPPRRAGVFIALALLSFFLMLGKYNPLYRLFMGIPPFSFFRFPARFGYVLTLALAVMSGYGLDNVLANRRVAVRLGILALALLILLTVFLLLSHAALDRWGGELEGRLRDAVEQPKLDRVLVFIRGLRETTRLGRADNLLGLGTLLLASLAVLACSRLKRWLAVSLLLACALADLIAFAWSYNPVTPREIALDRPVAARVLADREGLWRVAILDRHVPIGFEKDLLTASYGMLFGLADVEYPSPLIPTRVTEILDATGTSLAGIPPAEAIGKMRENRKLLDLMNVRFILTVHDIDLEGFRRLHGGRVKIYENEQYMPRAFIVGKVIPARGDEALEYMIGADFSPRREVLVETEDPSLPDAEYDVRGSACTVISYLPCRVVVEAEAPAGGWLVLSDTYYPGWGVRVDGEEATLHRANYIFRAVRLPPGSHTVEFVYRSQPFRRGTMLSLAGIVIVIGWVAIPPLRRLRLPG